VLFVSVCCVSIGWLALLAALIRVQNPLDAPLALVDEFDCIYRL
jgi:hypothetical protein